MKEKGSRFIAYAAPVSSREAAEELVAEISKKNYDATHNCFAYRVGMEANVESRFNDDGEPSGTAGKPILQAISGLDLVDVVVVVTRYFGGTKLGTGGLIRAYGGAASHVLSVANIETRFIKDFVRLQSSYHNLNTVLNAVQIFNAKVTESDYSENVTLDVSIRRSRTDQFIAHVVEQTAGRIAPHILDQST